MKKLFLLLFALLPTLLFADSVSQEQAKAVAEKFFASSQPSMTRAAASLRMIWDGESKATRSASEPAFYVFNNESGKGFVIVSGDDCIASPVLAYSFDQNFDAESMPENLYTWMNGVRSDINRARQNHQQATAEARKAWSLFEHHDMQPIKLLETALWDQRNPYNSKLPQGYVTGCPATAISIIMRYHKWPEKGVGVIPQSDERIPSITLGHTYDWDNMPLNYIGANAKQNEEVGVLMRDVGAMIRTQYGGGTAGAKPEETLPQLMPIYMRYNKNTIKSLFKSNFSDKEWHTILQKEIDENRPVLYGGYSSGGGHQFVLDGYAADNFYHVNWGWSGVSNGYYLLTDMNPPEQGAGGSSSADGFTNKQDAIIGIQPDPTNPGGGFFDLIAYKQFYKGKPYGLITTETQFTPNVQFKVDIKDFWNKGSRDFGGKIAIAHYAADGTFKNVVSNEINYAVYQLSINDNTEAYFKCTITQPIEKGDYLSGVFKFQNPSDWTPIHNGEFNNEQCIEKIVLAEGDPDPNPDPNPDPDPEPTVTYYDLSITVGEGGTVTYLDETIAGGEKTVKIEENKTAVLVISANEGYKMGTVLYNNINVAALVKDGVYTTPGLKANATFNVSFEKDEVGIADEAAEQIAVYALNGSIVIEGLGAATPVAVYTIDGALVASAKASSDALLIALPAGKTYVVRVADKACKVQL